GRRPRDHRGSGWVALAWSRHLALGATTSTFFNAPRGPVSTPLHGPPLFCAPSRRQLRGRGGAERLERLDDEEVPVEALQQRQRQPPPQVRHLRAPQVALVDARLDEAPEQPPQPAAAVAGAGRP